MKLRCYRNRTCTRSDRPSASITLRVTNPAPGITSIATYVDGGNNFFKLLIVMAIAWISGFVISFVMNKKEQ